MNTYPTRQPSQHTPPQNADLDLLAPGKALIIGPSGPAWFPPRLASAENFNPYHDELGRFTDSDHANGGAAKREEAKTPAHQPVGSIAMHPSSNKGFALCVVAAIQTLLATKKGMTNLPDTEAIKAQVAAAAKGILTLPNEGVDWNGLGVSATPEHLAAIVQKVLENNGVQTTVQPKYDSAKALSDALVASQQPAMISLHRAGTSDEEEHAVTVQWDAGRGCFLINNIGAKGGTQEFTQQQFEQGKINASILDTNTARSTRTMQYTIRYQHPSTSLKGP